MELLVAYYSLLKYSSLGFFEIIFSASLTDKRVRLEFFYKFLTAHLDYPMQARALPCPIEIKPSLSTSLNYGIQF